MYQHVADLLAQPGVVRLAPSLTVLRFECMKVASALAVVESLLEDGTVAEGDTLIDSSSGLYALSLALACARHGLRCHIVASPAVDPALMVQLVALGVTVERPQGTGDASFDQAARVERVREVVARDPSVHWMRQYHDARHRIGYQAVARSVAREVDVPSLLLVGGVGSGASTAGMRDGFRQAGVETGIIAVQPFGSLSFDSAHVDDPDFLISGLGSGIRFDNIDYDAYEQVHWIDFATARRGSLTVLRRHGLFAGLSSGACFAVSSWLLGTDDRPVVFISPDTGNRYVSTVFVDSEEVPDLGESDVPREVSSSDQLATPWCWTPWPRTRGGFALP